MARRWLLAVVVATVVLAGCSTSSGSPTAKTSTTADRTSSTATPVTSHEVPTTEVRASKQITAVGSDDDVCRAGLDAVAPDPYRGPTTVLASRTFGSGRWVICTSDSTGAGVVSARTGDGNRWNVAVLCAAAPFHAGDVIDAHIADADRAWLTDDVPAAPYHEHGWTRDAGKTWTCLRNPPQ
jgi:hypothetical protein